MNYTIYQRWQLNCYEIVVHRSYIRYITILHMSSMTSTFQIVSILKYIKCSGIDFSTISSGYFWHTIRMFCWWLYQYIVLLDLGNPSNKPNIGAFSPKFLILAKIMSKSHNMGVQRCKKMWVARLSNDADAYNAAIKKIIKILRIFWWYLG